MTSEISPALIIYSNDAHTWRLKLPATPERPNGGMVGIDGFSGSLSDPADAENIEMILRAEGYTPDMYAARAENGMIAIPIIRYRHP